MNKKPRTRTRILTPLPAPSRPSKRYPEPKKKVVDPSLEMPAWFVPFEHSIIREEDE